MYSILRNSNHIIGSTIEYWIVLNMHFSRKFKKGNSFVLYFFTFIQRLQVVQIHMYSWQQNDKSSDTP